MKFDVSDDVVLDEYIDKTLKYATSLIGWDCEYVDSYIKFNHSVPVRATIQLQYNIRNPFKNQEGTLNIFYQDIRQLNFTPQIQALDMPVIIREDKIRINSLNPVLLLHKSNGWKYIKTIPIYVLVLALVNFYLYDDESSLYEKLNILPNVAGRYKVDKAIKALPLEDLIDKLREHVKSSLSQEYKDIDNIIDEEIITPLLDHIERGEKVIESMSEDSDVIVTRSMLRENYNRDIFTWLGKYITRRNENKIGRRHLTEIIYGLLLDIFNHPYYSTTNLLDLILISIWKYNNKQYVPDNDWTFKRFRVREYLLYPILEQLLKCALRLRKTINLKLTKFWYDSKLFVYNSVVNPLGYMALRSRCTIKGPGALKYPNKGHRSVHESMKKVVDSISTGEREQAGIIHMVLNTEINELEALQNFEEEE